jgi:hypothetical protein
MMFNPDPGSVSGFSPIPDPGSRGQKGTRSRIWIRNTSYYPFVLVWDVRAEDSRACPGRKQSVSRQTPHITCPRREPSGCLSEVGQLFKDDRYNWHFLARCDWF